MLITQLIVEADKIKLADYVDPRTNRPNKLIPTSSKHVIVWTEGARNCGVCSKPPERKRSHFKCDTCNTYLHPKDCFEQFHSKDN